MMQNTILTPSALDGIYTFLAPLMETLADKVADRLRPVVEEKEPKYYSIAEVCELLSVTKPTLHAWTKQGLIPSAKVNGRRLYRAEDVERVAKADMKNRRIR